MSRGVWAVVAVGGVGAVGLGGWTWFLAGRTLDVMDQWSSVVSSFGTLLSLLVAVVALIVAVRDSGSPGATGSRRDGGPSVVERRSFRARNASGARVTLGDYSPITDRERNQ